MKSESNKLAVRGELALIAMVIMNSAGVLLMLHSGSGISAISSVPYGFQQVFPQLTLGTWTYMFQGLLVLVLMLLRRKFMPSYLFSFVVGFVFGKLMDLESTYECRAYSGDQVGDVVTFSTTETGSVPGHREPAG